MGLLILAGLGWYCRGLRKDRRAHFLLAGFLALAGLEFLWLGGEYFWVAPTACLIGLLALAAEAGKATQLAACGLALLGWNVYAGLAPRAKLENNEGYRRAIFVRDHTPYSSWIVVSGFGFPNQKVYLSYFAKRSREVLEYYLNRDSKEAALAKFTAWTREQQRLGMPMFLLPDMVSDQRALADLQRRTS
jgi:hypothetical protein